MTREIRTLLLNLHAGRLAKPPARRRRGNLRCRSVLARLIRRHRPDVVILTEVRDLAAVRRAAPGYTVVGAMRGGYECVAVLTRNTTLVVTHAHVEHVSDHLDDMHPARNFPVVTTTHRRTGTILTIIGVHLWALGEAWRTRPQVLNGHVKQTHAVVALAEHLDRVLAGGDYNEDLDDFDDHGHRSAPKILGDAGLSLTSRHLGQHQATSLEGRSLLDDVAYRGLTPLRRRTLPDPGSGADHHPVLTDHGI